MDMDEAWQPPPEKEPQPSPEPTAVEPTPFPDDDILPTASHGRGGAGTLLAVALLMLALVGGGAWWLLAKPAPKPQAQASTSEGQDLIQSARSLASQAQYTEAASQAGRGLAWLEVHSNNPKAIKDARVLTAKLYNEAGEYNKSAREYATLARSDPAYKKVAAETLARGERDQRILAGEDIQQAEQSFRQGDSEVARRLAERARALYSNNHGSSTQIAHAYAIIARCYVKDQQYAEAESNMKRAVQADGGNASYRRELASIRSDLASASHPDYYQSAAPSNYSQSTQSLSTSPSYPTTRPNTGFRYRQAPAARSQARPQPYRRPRPRPQPAYHPVVRRTPSGPRHWAIDSDHPPGY